MRQPLPPPLHCSLCIVQLVITPSWSSRAFRFNKGVPEGDGWWTGGEVAAVSPSVTLTGRASEGPFQTSAGDGCLGSPLESTGAPPCWQRGAAECVAECGRGAASVFPAVQVQQVDLWIHYQMGLKFILS